MNLYVSLFLVIMAFSSVASAQSSCTYYTSKSGSDSNPGTLTQPFLTMHKGAGVLKPGETLCVRSGTYNEEFNSGIPSGTSWTSPVTITSYPGETVIMKPLTGSCNGQPGRVFTFNTGQAYIVINGLIMDGTYTCSDVVKLQGGGSPEPHHIRISNSEIMYGNGQLILDSTGASSVAGYNEYINLKMHDNLSANTTPAHYHGFYISSSHNLVDGADVYRTPGVGVQIQYPTANYNIVRNTRSHDNAWVGMGTWEQASNNLFYNNLIWNNPQTGIQLYSGTFAGNNRVFNNDFFNNGNSNPQPGWGGGGILDGDSTAVIQNNIFYKNSADIENYAGGGTITNNLTGGVNPMFVNITTAPFNFHLQSGSTAIDKGITLTAVPDDLDGVKRPQGGAYDLGAYEYVSAATTASPSPSPSPSPTPSPMASPSPTPVPVTTDTTPPTVVVTSPANGSTVARHSTVTIRASATDNVKVVKVEFYVNGVLVCTDATAPYSCVWTVPGCPRKTYQLQTKAYDSGGNIGSSSIVTVNSR